MSELTIEKCRFLREKYPNCYPIILQSSDEKKQLMKCKLLVPKESSVCNLMSQIRHHNKLSSKEAYFLFVKNTLINTSDTISKIYTEHRSQNGFLYIIVKKESTFG